MSTPLLSPPVSSLRSTRRTAAFVLLGVSMAGGMGCFRRVERQLVQPARFQTLDERSPFLKAHLRSGSLYVLHGWRVESATGLIQGTGRLLSPDRQVSDSGDFSFPADSVALFETNVLAKSGANAALTVMAGVTAIVAGVCIATPKTCFGSCPTFYFAEGSDSTLQAEGFSASIAPGLEATDVDALVRAAPRGRRLALRLTNEGLETHVVRYAHLLAAPRPAGGRVFVTPGGVYRQSGPPVAPDDCHGREGSCLGPVRTLDGQERISLADSNDLAARETIDLEFAAPPPGDLGIVVTARQSLMTTYILYQELAWLGDRAGDLLSRLDRAGNGRPTRPDFGATLGRIEVLVPDGTDAWMVAGSVGETGPLASDTKVVPIPHPPDGSAARVRLRMSRGLWRIDRLGLVALGQVVQPVRLTPSEVRRDGHPDQMARDLLTDTIRTLVTLPGDAYEIRYRLPAAPERLELFLESRGYYLEWMRREWMAEQNPVRAALLLLDPAGALRAMAPEYKRLEPGMEAVFWNSRYARP
jgi:hypothetical protein